MKLERHLGFHLRDHSDEILNNWNKIYQRANVGQTVLVKIPDVDRKRTADEMLTDSIFLIKLNVWLIFMKHPTTVNICGTIHSTRLLESCRNFDNVLESAFYIYTSNELSHSNTPSTTLSTLLSSYITLSASH